jgi:hypothetical protein
VPVPVMRIAGAMKAVRVLRWIWLSWRSPMRHYRNLWGIVLDNL